MEGRGVRGAHGYFELHDGRRLCFGTSHISGWWVTVYKEGKSQGQGRGHDLTEAIEDIMDRLGADDQATLDAISPLLGEIGNIARPVAYQGMETGAELR